MRCRSRFERPSLVSSLSVVFRGVLNGPDRQDSAPEAGVPAARGFRGGRRVATLAQPARGWEKVEE